MYNQFSFKIKKSSIAAIILAYEIILSHSRTVCIDWIDWVKKFNELSIYNEREICYGLKLKVLSNRTTLVLSNTRELDRVPKTK